MFPGAWGCGWRPVGGTGGEASCPLLPCGYSSGSQGSPPMAPVPSRTLARLSLPFQKRGPPPVLAELRLHHSCVASQRSVAYTSSSLHSVSSVKVLGPACFPGWTPVAREPPPPTSQPQPTTRLSCSSPPWTSFFLGCVLQLPLGFRPRSVLHVWLFTGEHPGLGRPETLCTLGRLTSKTTD